jgi:hypothetical protein
MVFSMRSVLVRSGDEALAVLIAASVVRIMGNLLVA